MRVRGIWVKAVDDLVTELEAAMAARPELQQRFARAVDQYYLAEHRDGPEPGWDSPFDEIRQQVPEFEVEVGPRWHGAVQHLVGALVHECERSRLSSRLHFHLERSLPVPRWRAP